MDTELLKTFLEVQKTRHFGKAADNLYLTQSAVSFRIRQLEQGLGTSLFYRSRNNIQLTAAGEALLPHAIAVIQALSNARLQIQQQTQLIASINFCYQAETAYALNLAMCRPLIEALKMRSGRCMAAATVPPDADLYLSMTADAPAGFVSHQLPSIEFIAVRVGDTTAPTEYRLNWLRLQTALSPLSPLICNDVGFVLQQLQQLGGLAWLPRELVVQHSATLQVDMLNQPSLYQRLHIWQRKSSACSADVIAALLQKSPS